MSKLLSVDDLSAILGCHKITVYRLVRQGKITCRRIGALLKFSDTDIESYLESVKVEKLGGSSEK
jgi:excisionase family DNA binding protein